MKRKFVPVATPELYWFEADDEKGEWVMPDGQRFETNYTARDGESFVANKVFKEVPNDNKP